MAKCDFFGHKWKVAFLSGQYENINVEFIGAFCSRCNKGYKELLDAGEKMTNIVFCTYNEKYWKR